MAKNIFQKVGDEFTENLEQSINDATPRIFNSPYGSRGLAPTVSNPFAEDKLTRFNYNTSYSGTDCTVLVQLNDKLITLGNLETFSYSVFRDKKPVRTLGRSYSKGYTSGPKTISGSLIFIVFDRSPFYDIIKEINYVKNSSERKTSPMPDELPALDYILVFHNEYGYQSIMKLYGVELFTEGQVHSINDIYSENTMQYMARDMDQLMSYEEMDDFRNMMFQRQAKGKFVDNHLSSLISYKQRLERELNQVNNTIDQIGLEKGKRAVAGVFTLGISQAASALSSLKDKDYVTREDLENKRGTQLKIKEYLLTELKRVNKQIQQYDQNIVGYNAQNSDSGTAGNYDLRRADP